MNKNLTVYAQDIVALVSMSEAMELYGCEVGSKGFSLCPFHREKTPSMKIYRDHYHCFGCGESGDVISFVMKLFRLNFCDALKKINADFSLNLPIGERMTIRQAAEHQRKSMVLEEARRRERKQREDAFLAYAELTSEFVRLSENYKTYRPFPGAEQLKPLFIEACHRLEYVNYLIDTIDWKGGSSSA